MNDSLDNKLSPICSGTTTSSLDTVHSLLSGIPGIGSLGEISPEIRQQLLQSSDYETDFCIIGSGPAGYVAAIRAAQIGARVTVVEKGFVGGTCLNVGCIPTKVLLSTVAVLDHCKSSSEFGIDIKSFSLNIPVMAARKEKIVKQLTSGVEGLFRKNKIKLVRGAGKITDVHEVTVETESGPQAIRTDKIIIATGSVPATLPLPGFEIGNGVWTSTEALDFTEVPKKILIIGAGAIGLESGYTFARMGSEVLVVELMSQILPAADTEVANELQKSLEKAGIKFMLDAGVISAEDTPNGKRVRIRSAEGEQALEFDRVLVAVGRRAVLDGIGLESVGVSRDERKIFVNDSMQTNIQNIYAIGDAIGEPMLAHVGWTEGIVAVEHALGLGARMSYKAFPACVYTTPEAASVGLTEAQARSIHGNIKVGKFGFAHNGKAMGLGETEGFVKIICEPRYGEVLGVHVVGPHATDIITEAVLAIQNELTVDELVATIHPHPTLSEVVQEAAYDTMGRSIHK